MTDTQDGLKSLMLGHCLLLRPSIPLSPSSSPPPTEPTPLYIRPHESLPVDLSTSGRVPGYLSRQARMAQRNIPSARRRVGYRGAFIRGILC